MSDDMIIRILAVLAGIAFMVSIGMIVFAVFCRRNGAKITLAVIAGALLAYSLVAGIGTNMYFLEMEKNTYDDILEKTSYSRPAAVVTFVVESLEYNLDTHKLEWEEEYVDFDEKIFEVIKEYSDKRLQIKYSDVDKVFYINKKSSIYHAVWFYQIDDELYIRLDFDKNGDEYDGYENVYWLDGYLADKVKQAYQQYEDVQNEKNSENPLTN